MASGFGLLAARVEVGFHAVVLGHGFEPFTVNVPGQSRERSHPRGIGSLAFQSHPEAADNYGIWL